MTGKVLGLAMLHGATTIGMPGMSRLTVTLGTRTIEWDFMVTEMRDNEGILGNDFTMAHRLTVQPHEGVVYLPEVSSEGTENLGE